MALRPGLLAGALIAAIACGRGGPSMDISWTGADTGSVSLAASATRCGAGPVALLAVSGDTGVAIALYPADGPAPGTYPVSAGAEAVAPPAASLGARWLDSSNVAAYRASSGSVTLREGVPALGGSFAVAARRLDRPDSITLTGSFQGVPVGPCPADSTPPGV